MSMPSFNKTFEQFFKDRDWLMKTLFGGLLSYIPILNFFVFGYFWEMMREVRSAKTISMPQWDDWSKRLLDGCYAALILLFFVGVPLTLGWIVTELFYLMLGGIGLGFLAEVPLSICIFFAPMLGALGLYTYLGEPDWSVFFRVHDIDFKGMKKLLSKTWMALIIPSLAFLALLYVGGFALCGFTFFLGGSIFVSHSVLVFNAKGAK